jgi:hypothetical protein
LQADASTGVDSPSPHDIAVTTEDLGQTADNHVGVREHIDIDEVSDGLIHDHRKVVLVCQGSDSFQVGRSEQGVTRKLAEESKIPLPALQSIFQVVQALFAIFGIEDATRAELLKNLKCIYVWEAASLTLVYITFENQSRDFYP